MICRRCGNRIPEYLISRESFQCPECGRQFGSPAAMARRSSEYEYDRKPARYDRGGESYARRSSRFEPEYDDRPADDRYYDDGQGYYDEPQYDDGGYYDEPQYDNGGYYDEPQYDDGQYYDDDPYYGDSADYSDDFDDFDAPRRTQKPQRAKPQQRTKPQQARAPKPKKPKQPARTMKLVVILYVLIIEVIALIVVACIGAGRNAGPTDQIVPGTQPAAVETAPTRDPNATDSPYPVV